MKRTSKRMKQKNWNKPKHFDGMTANCTTSCVYIYTSLITKKVFIHREIRWNKKKNYSLTDKLKTLGALSIQLFMPANKNTSMSCVGSWFSQLNILKMNSTRVNFLYTIWKSCLATTWFKNICGVLLFTYSKTKR